jgi:hypothetical protein
VNCHREGLCYSIILLAVTRSAGDKGGPSFVFCVYRADNNSKLQIILTTNRPSFLTRRSRFEFCRVQACAITLILLGLLVHNQLSTTDTEGVVFPSNCNQCCRYNTVALILLIFPESTKKVQTHLRLVGFLNFGPISYSLYYR